MACMTSSPVEVPRRGRGRPPGISERVRSDVYDAVRELLIKSGYAALRLDDVAAAAGVHKSTLYRQWTTKAQLVRDVINASQVARYPRPDEGSWAADIQALCRELVRLFRSPTTIAFMRTRAVADDPELVQELHELGVRDMGFVREPFERAIARGEIDPGLSVDTLIEMVTAPFMSRVIVARLPVDDAFGESIATVMRAIGRPDGPSNPSPGKTSLD
jgi:AcrR family transcriptional regulator